MAVNQQRKKAMKRLAFDQQELLRSPVDGVSAAPLDENMLEWHCNFEFDSVIYHVILFFPENYPYKSPSAEFVPAGFQFVGGATKQGKKGTQVGKRAIRKYSYKVLNEAVADLRGTPPVPNSFNFMQFMGEFGNIVCWRPPSPESRRGNPGSATAKRNSLEEGFVEEDLRLP